ncbi:MAG: helix-turn-helix transcriptional regulator [Candidatus Obscuribacterales bacterium]|nr:helix-turn-helix transcriptional regulator [Candidatus Obscuribacterales bacterium]
MNSGTSKGNVIARRMLEAREAAGLNRKQAASLSDMTRQQILDLESGDLFAATRVIDKFAEIYCVNRSWLGGLGPDIDESKLKEFNQQMVKLSPGDQFKLKKLLTMVRE